MKKRIMALTALSSFLVFNQSYAAETTTSTVSAGITPDSIFYKLDRLVEDLQLKFTSDKTKEDELLLQFAQERLSETKEMVDQKKTNYASEALDDYISKLSTAENTSSELLMDKSIDKQTKAAISDELEQTTEIDDNMVSQLPQAQQTAVVDKTDEASLVANVINGIDPASVQTLRAKDLGYGEIAKIVALSQITGKSVDELATSLSQGTGFGELAKENGLKPQEVALQVKQTKLQSALTDAQKK